ncbi:IS2 transposase TnpB [Klebsiella michiganensis]|nr:IS2 transposase TnpB [Klebsiella michiganensis]
MDSARALVAKGRGIALVSRTMGVSRAQLSLRINRSADWQDKRCNRRNDEADEEGVASENGIYGHSRFCNTDFDDKLACLNLSGV